MLDRVYSHWNCYLVIIALALACQSIQLTSGGAALFFLGVLATGFWCIIYYYYYYGGAHVFC